MQVGDQILIQVTPEHSARITAAIAEIPARGEVPVILLKVHHQGHFLHTRFIAFSPLPDAVIAHIFRMFAVN